MTTQNMWQSTNPASVISGGQGNASLPPPYTVLCSGTTSTNPVQVVASPGINPNVLTSNGPASLPSFKPSTAHSGALILLQTQTVTNVSSVVFNSHIDSTYLDYVICISNVTNPTQAPSSTLLSMDWSIDGGSSYLNSNYTTGTIYNNVIAQGGSIVGSRTSTTTCVISGPMTFFPGGIPLNPPPPTLYYNGQIWLSSITSSTVTPYYNGQYMMRWDYVTPSSAALMQTNFGWHAGGNSVAHNINAIKFSFSSGNITTGTFSLYGLVQ